MVNDTTAVPVNTDAACEDARKDAEAIRDAFSHKGIEEAYTLLKEERKNAVGLTAAEKDIWEKELVNSLSANGGKTDILPGLSLAFLKENKGNYKNPDDSDEYDVRTVQNDAKRMFDKREMEDEYGAVNKSTFLNKVDDIDVTLLGNAAELLKKNDFGGEKVKDIDDLDELLEDNTKNAEKEAGFQKTRDFNKTIAEALVKNPRLFGVLDEANFEQETDGQIDEAEVDKFLDHCEKNESFKKLFTEEELKAVADLKATFDDANNHKDDNQVFVKHWNPWIGRRQNWITQDSIKEALGGEEGVKAIEAKVAEAKAKLAEGQTEEDKKDETKDDEVKDTTEEKKDETEVKTEVVDTETQMVNDAVQKPGEGPYQVAARILRGKGDMTAQIALTKVLKEQLIEDTGAKDYAEAITKLDVGHPFFTCDSLEKIREKVAASGNQTLMDIFGAPTKTSSP